MRQGKIYASVYVRLVDRKDRKRSVDEMSALLRERLRQVAGITVTHVGLLDSVGGNKQVQFSIQGPDQDELERITLLAHGQGPRHSRPGRPGLQRQARTSPRSTSQIRRDVASDLGLSVSQIGAALRTLVAGQTVGNWRARDDQTYDVNVRLARDARNARAGPRTPAVRRGQQCRRQHARGAAEPGGRGARDHQPEPDQPARPDARGQHHRQCRRALGRRGVRTTSARRWTRISIPPGYSYKFGGSTKNMTEAFGYAISALVLAIVFIYMILASQFKSFPAAAGADDRRCR